MSESEYQSLLAKQGLHSIVVVLPTHAMRTALAEDWWVRGVVSLLGVMAVVGLGVGWRNVTKSADLQVRLIRASELNSHLKELNLAAAGLAHETRNPLNIIRGLAQMISRQSDASAEIRRQTSAITDEVDRVTAQLNEFINYSKPREVRRAAVSLNTVIGEVVRALAGDAEEKGVHVHLPAASMTIEADERLLRQALFNLLLNALQAAEPGGEVRFVITQAGSGEATLEIGDNGPGIPPELRSEVFKPYFTTHQKGTGLGLAVVQQIILAHGWEIHCFGNEPRGALFRLSRLKPLVPN
jgi:signal transduction histidine kinase